MLAAPIDAAAELTVRLQPSDCVGTTADAGDCYRAIEAAVGKCRVHGAGSCRIVLAPGRYTVACPPATRTSSTQTEAPGVLLANLVGPVSFGGVAALPRPELLVDYSNGGCAGIVAENCSDVTVQHLTIDALRLPFTVGTVTEDASLASTVKFRPEADTRDRAAVYAWDPQRWPWLNLFLASQAVLPGARATRELPSIGMVDERARLHSSTLDHDGVVTVEFSDNRSLNLRAGERVFLKHFDNMQSWGVYGRNVSGMSLRNVSLWSVSGMGYRCDLCLGQYSLTDSDVSLKPNTDRPMSITADAVHFMHHSGHVEVLRSSFQGGGDDGLNVHGNFIVLDSVTGPNTVKYIDETGPGWITAAPTFIVGDEIEFYSRMTLQRLGSNFIAEATATEVVFVHPLPADLKRYDMFLSVRRVASLEIRDCFFGNSNSRGAVVSAVNVTIVGNTFANLSHPGVIFIEGGTGAGAGDYTEGPFSQNIWVENNSFVRTASVNAGDLQVNNRAALQIMGCVPIGTCGLSGNLPAASASQPLAEHRGGAIRIVPMGKWSTTLSLSLSLPFSLSVSLCLSLSFSPPPPPPPPPHTLVELLILQSYH